jgi:hypothetical protein
MNNQLIVKDLILGCLIGIISAFFGSFLFVSYMTNFDFYEGIISLKQAGRLGQLITLGAILNIIIFFALLKLNKEILARGVVLATIILAIITIFV